MPLIKAVRNIALKGHSPRSAAFTHQRRVRHLTHRTQRLDRIGRTARNVELFFSSDNQIKEVQRGLQLRRHRRTLDKAALTVAVPRHTPEVRAVINIQRRPRPMLARQFQRLEHRGFGLNIRQMRPRRQNRPRRGNKSLVNIGLTQRHIRAVFPIENQRELFFVANAQNNQRG